MSSSIECDRVMASLDPESANTSNGAPKKKRSVTIMDTKPEVEEVSEKHGPLHNAIPKMPVALAVTCCILNIVLPGIGTLISSFTVFCGATTRIERPVKACLINVLAALLQMVSFIVIFGWIWSILWGMTFVQLSLAKGGGGDTVPYFVRRQSSVAISEPPSATCLTVKRASTTGN